MIASVSILTAVFIIIAANHLGATSLPSSCWQPAAGAETVILDFGSVQRLKEVYIFLYDANRTKFDLYGATAPGEWQKLYNYDNKEHVHFCSWDKIALGRDARFLKFRFSNDSTGKLGEIMVISASNQRIPIENIEGRNATALIDEQNYTGITAEDGAYFDEMYFVRTAYEHLHFKEPYEWTHPPLGKLIIAAGILIFGMNPFGWRFMGVLAAAAMIPLIFLLCTRIFGSSMAGLFAASLLSFDFMHFSLARLATGEIYIALFSLLSFMFAFDYLYERKPASLFLSIVSFGLCFAVKWTAMFTLISVLALAMLCNKRTNRRLFYDWQIVVAGLFVSAAIYLASYIPWLFAGGGHSLMDVLKLQFQMFGYHAGIEATHPFSSPWWSWQLMLKPLWLYINTLNGEVSTIVLMGNPAIWWGSIPALAFIVAKILKYGWRCDHKLLFIAVPFLLLWLPYSLITRILFIYHFVADVPFMILAITYCMMCIKNDRRRLIAMIGFLILVVALFGIFYTVISGYPVVSSYRDSLKLLPGWSF